MSRRVLAQMVVRNEAGRYLECVLEALGWAVDGIHVYDDLSSDDTMVVALNAGATVTRRPFLVPSFAEDESRFRQAAWMAMEDQLRPIPGRDWILAVDADELLVAPSGLGPAVDAAVAAYAGAVAVPIPEVFGLRPGADGAVIPMVRTDGLWAGLAGPRLAVFEHDGLFREQALAGGSVPSYVRAGAQSTANHGVELLHLGYVDPADRREKHQRYAGHAGQPGQNAAHVASILTTPYLEPWPGEVRVWRGLRGDDHG